MQRSKLQSPVLSIMKSVKRLSPKAANAAKKPSKKLRPKRKRRLAKSHTILLLSLKMLKITTKKDLVLLHVLA